MNTEGLNNYSDHNKLTLGKVNQIHTQIGEEVNKFQS